nr:Chain A, TbiB1 [Thermobaculum terrenum ATCC BAA-798]5V1U_B Chain B, TbiB1 [Thermobaculum terrenum ATCC BAA-798]5V1U_C Chain C, TbiB1 [Thermobaculum terrenum ATCC BAA-798]5V1U_D Chain D, TbiB1 [Thermobaculum terrenum ATCC BAA-798]5V1V_A Chain A, TbiB1 [Thermobaculum terrenum ATCC BAA-798]5V1V_B Chain B, TbiB1 [Thermobaculum terrenum ATCC BAA-798]
SNAMKISDAVVSAHIDDEVVLLHLQTGTYFGLDAVGSRIWSLLEEGKRPEEIVDAICAEYSVDRPTVERDLRDFLRALANKELLEGYADEA